MFVAETSHQLKRHGYFCFILCGVGCKYSVQRRLHLSLPCFPWSFFLTGSPFRSREEACSSAGNKACQEKMRRDCFNDRLVQWNCDHFRFMELSAALEPGRPPKTDKATILSDVVRILTQLYTEAQGLQESNNQLQ
jgi:hypothetical protein